MRIFKATKQLNSDKWKSVLCLFGYTNRNPATRGVSRGRRSLSRSLSHWDIFSHGITVVVVLWPWKWGYPENSHAFFIIMWNWRSLEPFMCLPFRNGSSRPCFSLLLLRVLTSTFTHCPLVAPRDSDTCFVLSRASVAAHCFVGNVVPPSAILCKVFCVCAVLCLCFTWSKGKISTKISYD